MKLFGIKMNSFLNEISEENVKKWERFCSSLVNLTLSACLVGTAIFAVVAGIAFALRYH